MIYEKSPENPTFMPENGEGLKECYATRTVLLDQEGKVAILNVKNHGYYKIPGGGVDDGEDIEASAQREVWEETGCDCIINGSLGRLETEVPVWNMLDISDGFIALVTGEKLRHIMKIGSLNVVLKWNGLIA